MASSSCPSCPPQDIQELPSMTNNIETTQVAIEKQQQQHDVDHCKKDKNDNNDNDDNSYFSSTRSSCSRSFKLSLTSNMLFVVASFLYLSLSVYDLNYANELLSESTTIINSSDDDDDDVASDMTAGAGDVWLTKTKAKQITATTEDYYYTAHDDQGYESAAADETTLAYNDDDYYVFETKNGTWVSKYQIIYFVAALCFVLSGAVDFIDGSTVGERILSVISIMAGGFGLFSAMLVEQESEYLSDVFNSVSVHLFLVEAVGLFFRHRDTEQIDNGAVAATASSTKQQQLLLFSRLQCFVQFGNVSWITGTCMDVIMSYWDVRGTGNSIPHSIAGVVSSILWLVCSLIYLTATCIVECQVVRKQQVDNISKAHHETSSDESSTSSSENHDKV